MNQVNFNWARMKKWKELTSIVSNDTLESSKKCCGKLKSRESLKLAHTSFEIFNFIWIQYHLFVNIQMSRTVVSSRNIVYREQVILYSFIGVSMHTIAWRVLEILSLRDHKRENWQNSVIKEDIDVVGTNTVFVEIIRKKEIIVLNTSVSIRFANVKAGAPLTGWSSWYALLANKNFLSWRWIERKRKIHLGNHESAASLEWRLKAWKIRGWTTVCHQLFIALHRLSQTARCYICCSFLVVPLSLIKLFHVLNKAIPWRSIRLGEV